MQILGLFTLAFFICLALSIVETFANGEIPFIELAVVNLIVLSNVLFKKKIKRELKK